MFLFGIGADNDPSCSLLMLAIHGVGIDLQIVVVYICELMSHCVHLFIRSFRLGSRLSICVWYVHTNSLCRLFRRSYVDVALSHVSISARLQYPLLLDCSRMPC